MRKKTIFPLTILLLSLMSAAGCETLQHRVVARVLDLPAPLYSVVVDQNVRVPMGDGVELSADVYRPDAPGRFPVILTRTPYGKRNPDHKYEFAGKLFASQGFVFLCQDVRGKYESGGQYYPYVHEARDGYDTLTWAAGQAWSNGRVGTYGFSYWGSTQWLTAPMGHPALRAMVPIVTSQNLYNRWIHGGVFRFNDVLGWHFVNAGRTEQPDEHIDWNAAVRHLPLIEADDALGPDIPAYNDWIAHPVPGPYWDPVCVDDRVPEISAPALIIDGWYDYYLDDALADFNRMRQEGSGHARETRMIVGPWTHTSRSRFDDVDFGKEAGFMQNVRYILNWYRCWLAGDQTALADEAPIRLFVMGKNEWRSEKEWPLERTRYTRYYLHSRGNAGRFDGDGILSPEAPIAEPEDRYVYDPKDPTPNIGGTTIYSGRIAGPCDQAPLYDRRDVLYFSTPPLTRDLEVTGPVKLVLHAASSAPDTDFAATLVDVHPDGKAVNLKTGIVRARFRKSPVEPEFLEKGQAYAYEIPIGATSNVFREGHRIRVQVTSAYFPEFGRNLNTGAPIGQTTETQAAEQTIFHDADRASYLLLPVIPD